MGCEWCGFFVAERRLTAVVIPGYLSVGPNQWRCIACKDGKIRDSRAVSRHDITLVHTNACAHYRSRDPLVAPEPNDKAGGQDLITPLEHGHVSNEELRHRQLVETYEYFSEAGDDHDEPENEVSTPPAATASLLGYLGDKTMGLDAAGSRAYDLHFGW